MTDFGIRTNLAILENLHWDSLHRAFRAYVQRLAKEARLVHDINGIMARCHLVDLERRAGLPPRVEQLDDE